MASHCAEPQKNEAPGRNSVPGPILFLGAPGVGKGTQSKELMERWGIPQISTGDLLRRNVAAGTTAGLTAKDLIERGHLAPDAMVCTLVIDRLQEPDVARGYILDGFPRTLAQAYWYDDYLAGQDGALPVVAVSLKVDYNQLLRRVTGRRNCPVCQRIYNIYSRVTQQEGHCDVDGAALVQRADDEEAVFEERMRAYEEATAPVIAHYREVGRLIEVDGMGAIDEVASAIVHAVAKLRS